jgi:hypothetical protein
MLTRAALVSLLLVLLLAPGAALGASPDPTLAAVGDPRSTGSGPGLVGDPLGAILGVSAVGGVALVLTLLYVRVTDRPAGGHRR